MKYLKIALRKLAKFLNNQRKTLFIILQKCWILDEKKKKKTNFPLFFFTGKEKTIKRKININHGKTKSTHIFIYKTNNLVIFF